VAEEKPEIRIIKRKKAHAGHHGGAWKVAYADFVTAMMAFFLVMWITGMSNEVKAAVAGYFKDPEAFMQQAKAGNMLFSVTEAKAGSISKRTTETVGDDRKILEGAKEKLIKMVSTNPEFSKMKKYIDIKLTDEGLKIELLDDKESLFFDSGSAKIKPSTCHLLVMMTEEFKRLSNKVVIEGHTDSRPLARGDGYSNWELSSDRANAARRVMAHAGLGAGQVAEVRGYAATQPRDPEHPEHYSNRRVSIMVVTKNAQRGQGTSSSILGDKGEPADQSH
jgi:chemotaxis protein MotB